jgi:hypothetical protein
MMHLILRLAHSLQAFLMAIAEGGWTGRIDDWLQSGWLVRLNGKGSIWSAVRESYLGMGLPLLDMA